jgi:oligosaccharyltransferase complex subunit gamma
LFSLASSFTLEDKIRKLEANTSPVYELNTKAFNALTAEPRNYTLFVTLTTSNPQHKCAACGEFDPNFESVALAYKSTNQNGLYFAKLDYKHGQPIFEKLQVKSVPMVLRFPPTSGPMAINQDYDQYEMTKHGFEADAFAQYVNQLYKLNVFRTLIRLNLKLQLIINITRYLQWGSLFQCYVLNWLINIYGYPLIQSILS